MTPIDGDAKSQTLAAASRVLDLNTGKRSAAPSDVWDVYRYISWRLTVWNLIEDFVDQEVKDAFVAQPADYVVSDDLSWLDDLVFEVRGLRVDSKNELADRLHRHYRAMRACHGTSVPSIDALYERGLRPLVIESYQDEARQLFLSGKFPELSEENLQAAIAHVEPATREGRVYFEANERLLVEMCGHYMLYGSEYLTALAANLGGTQDYRRVLKGRHKPTLLICDVPLVHIGHRTVADFAGMALASVFKELLDGEAYKPERWEGMGFSIGVPLDGANIVGHCHPTIRRDPLQR